MTELQWMAMLRDVPFQGLSATPQFGVALADMRKQFNIAIAADEPGGLHLGRDLPMDAAGNLDLKASTLFRCGLKDEDQGPIVSQFFLHDIAYGAQLIEQKVRPYAAGQNFLTDYDSWIRAQNTGYDAVYHGYSKDNDFVSAPPVGIPSLEQPGGPRRIATMRDIARFVNKDALHQAYFNATLLCLNWGVPFDPGSPYGGYKRQVPFGTFGGPDLLTRVSEVAGRALAVVWRQKWEIHRRLRPEAYGGLMQMQHFGHDAGDGQGAVKRAYGLPDMVFDSEASQIARQTGNKNLFLPIAFTAGSPPHPAYGAGLATVAGACITVLKAWLDDSMTMAALFAKGAKHPVTDAPVVISETNAAGELIPYGGPGVTAMTVGGELNKLACNVAMGRSMGGVHWRSDNTRSLRLGEQIAAELLRGESLGYAEKAVGGAAPTWSFTSFNGDPVVISAGTVRVNGAAVLPKAGPL
ncbi:vanadium-dependent haloperoxidase (plasmid) [Polymorphobacter sp. PAMC 29334]|uniref:vanadium-dependent haloperoxidase n=1 Tax=Polymorphobacter sp. PAMC 29334 TaxID=2862331 RepID=UPI001C77CE04|nr:vanadium-dependent haloperoxidase [Polymorphobacter sp. PAMC 29334]QYE32972.1 vanadium-dependent haloperoxidase [Polymorphobacter sp. PAMC 29334]